MNHLAIGQAGSYGLCSQQKDFFHIAAASVLHFYAAAPISKGDAIPMHQIAQAQNNLQMLFTAPDIITSWDLP